MQKITKEYEVYEYEELSEEVKEKVRSNLDQFIVEDKNDWVPEYLSDLLKEKYDLTSCKVYYSFNYCQGDGLYLESDNLLESKYILSKIREKLNTVEKRKFTRLLNEGLEMSSHHNDYYGHKGNSYDVDCSTCYLDMQKNDDELVDKVLEIASNTYVNICRDLEAIGYDTYETTEDDIIDTIEANEYKFLKNGTIFS